MPNLVLGLPAGALADRWDRRKLMLWSDAGRAVLTAAIPVSYWLDVSTITVILIVVLPINALRVLSDVGFQSSIPGLVGRENLARANSSMEAALSVPFIVGPALAGVLVATVGAAETIALDAASFALSAMSLLFVRRALRAERPAEMPRISTDIVEGIRFVSGHALLRVAIAYWSLMAFATAAILPALAYFLTVDQGEGEQLFGIVGSVWSVGYLIGSLLAGRLGGRTLGLQLLAGGAGIGLALMLLAATSSVTAYLAAGFAIGAALALQTDRLHDAARVDHPGRAPGPRRRDRPDRLAVPPDPRLSRRRSADRGDRRRRRAVRDGCPRARRQPRVRAFPLFANLRDGSVEPGEVPSGGVRRMALP